VARSVLLAAEVVDGEAAHRLGLVARLGDLDEALAWADELAALAPLTVAGHKMALERLVPPLPPDPEVTAAFARAWASADLAEGRAAFAERRAPVFRGE
jgi:enoyl-CoA hydratase